MKTVLLCIDLTTRLRHDEQPMAGREYLGILRVKLPSEGNFYGDQYAFDEVNLPSTVTRRNVHTFEGRHITCTKRLSDSQPRLNFKNLHIDGSFNVDLFSIEVMNEIRKALKGFVEEK